MSNQARRPLSARARQGAGLLLVSSAALLIGACASGPPPPPPAGQGLVQNRSLPPVPLIDAQGRPTSLSAFKGKYVVLANFLSLCQDECPLVTGAFLAMQRDVRAAGLADRVAFVEVTVDPGRDTPARLAAYSQRFGADWPLLTGKADDLAKLWRFFGVSVLVTPEEQPAKLDWLTGTPLTYDVSHTDGFILLDRSGHERFVDANPPNLHGKLRRELAELLNSGGLNNLRHQSGPSWTLSDAVAALSWLVGTTIPQSAST